MANHEDFVRQVSELAAKHFKDKPGEPAQPFGMQFRKGGAHGLSSCDLYPAQAAVSGGTTATVSVMIAIPLDTDTDPPEKGQAEAS